MDRRLLVYGSVFVALVAIVAFFIGVITTASFNLSSIVRAEENENVGLNINERGSFAPIVEKTSPAVVSIEGKRTLVYESPWNDFFNDPFFKRFFGEVPRKELKRDQKWLGSGFIIEFEGKDYILTNNHVVEKAEELTIRLSDDREFSNDEVELIGSDPLTDLAVIRLKTSENLPDIIPGSVEDIKVGDWVVAIGNPFGLYGTVTAGVVSAKGRSGIPLHRNVYENFIQTDAAINPGNSGGPLLNVEGKAVGVNTVILSRSGGNIGIGFAIPIDMAMEILRTLVKEGKIVRGYLGIHPGDLNRDIKESLNFKYSKGVYILRVEDGGPAFKAGLLDGDIILSIDGEEVEDASRLRNIIASKKPGRRVEVVVWRNGKERKINIVLGERPEASSSQEMIGGLEWLGMHLLPSNSAEAKRYWGEENVGVFVNRVEPESPAGRVGVSSHTLIIGVQRQNKSMTIKNMDSIVRAKQEFLPPLLIRLKFTNGRVEVVAIKE